MVTLVSFASLLVLILTAAFQARCISLTPFLNAFSYALLGAASFLGGSMRMTVSLCVIMVEITNNLKLLPLIMLVLLTSKVGTCSVICPYFCKQDLSKLHVANNMEISWCS